MNLLYLVIIFDYEVLIRGGGDIGKSVSRPKKNN